MPYNAPMPNGEKFQIWLGGEHYRRFVAAMDYIHAHINNRAEKGTVIKELMGYAPQGPTPLVDDRVREIIKSGVGSFSLPAEIDNLTGPPTISTRKPAAAEELKRIADQITENGIPKKMARSTPDGAIPKKHPSVGKK